MGDPTYDNAADLDAEGIPVLEEPASDDEGIIPPRDHQQAAFGTTAEEMRRGDDMTYRDWQEEREVTPDDIDLRHAEDDPLLDGLPVGQLVQPGDEDVDAVDDEASVIAAPGERTGVALSAEEAAMHITTEP